MKLDSSKWLLIGTLVLSFGTGALQAIRQDILVKREIDKKIEDYIQEKESIIYTQEETEPY